MSQRWSGVGEADDHHGGDQGGHQQRHGGGGGRGKVEIPQEAFIAALKMDG